MRNHLRSWLSIEPHIWSCLWRGLIARRPLGPREFAYHKRSALGVFLAMIILTAPFEILAYELLIPWALLRLLLLFATVYGVLWLSGYYASLRVLPYRLDADGLHVSYGVLAAGFVPYTAIRTVRVERQKAPNGKDGMQPAPGRAATYLAVGGRTDVTLLLVAPVVLHGLFHDAPPASTLYLAADAPDGLAAALSAAIAALPPAATPSAPVAAFAVPDSRTPMTSR